MKIKVATTPNDAGLEDCAGLGVLLFAQSSDEERIFRRLSAGQCSIRVICDISGNPSALAIGVGDDVIPMDALDSAATTIAARLARETLAAASKALEPSAAPEASDG